MDVINDSFTLGKKVLRRTRQSEEYLNFVKIKQSKQDDYNRACRLFKQRTNKSKSIAGDHPFAEGYVTELGLDNKTREG